MLNDPGTLGVRIFTANSIKAWTWGVQSVCMHDEHQNYYFISQLLVVTIYFCLFAYDYLIASFIRLKQGLYLFYPQHLALYLETGVTYETILK